MVPSPEEAEVRGKNGYAGGSNGKGRQLRRLLTSASLGQVTKTYTEHLVLRMTRVHTITKHNETAPACPSTKQPKHNQALMSRKNGTYKSRVQVSKTRHSETLNLKHGQLYSQKMTLSIDDFTSRVLLVFCWYFLAFTWRLRFFFTG